MKISILVPTYNEQENVEPLAAAIKAQFSEHLSHYDYEIVFIDNDSKDATRAKLRALCTADNHIKAIFNARNFGQFKSPFYGLCQTTGDCTISMCADFQDPVEMIPKLVEAWESGAKIVCAIKTQSRENRFVRFLRSVYYKLIKRFSSVEQIEHFTGFGLYDKSFVDVCRQLDDPAPCMRGIVAELGFRKVEIPYEQARRRAGKTHNNFTSLYDAAMQNFTTYTKTPTRFLTLIGGISLGASILGAIACLVLHLCGITALSLPLILCTIGFFGSLGLLGIGILGEYLFTIQAQATKRPLVVEQERIGIWEQQTSDSNNATRSNPSDS